MIVSTTWDTYVFQQVRNVLKRKSDILATGMHSVLTQRGYHPMDLQHDFLIQSSLAWIQEIPLLLGERHSHLFEEHELLKEGCKKITYSDIFRQ